MKNSKLLLASFALLLLSAPAIADHHGDKGDMKSSKEMKKEMKTVKVALKSADGMMIGSVTAMEAVKGTILRIEANNIPEGWHALHFHKKGDCSDHEAGFKLSGGHVNPDNNKHGFQNPLGYEVGDLPNVYAHKDGVIKAEMHSRKLKIKEHLLDKDGAAIVMHENADDMFTQPIGGAGPRIACAAFTKRK